MDHPRRMRVHHPARAETAAMKGVSALAVVVVAGAAAAPARAERLSDERTLSRWAYPERLGWARSAPATTAGRVARLRALTEDGHPELYLALRRRVADDGRTWVQIRLPRRPNGSRGWVPREYLGPLRKVRTALEIDRARLRARLRVHGRLV